MAEGMDEEAGELPATLLKLPKTEAVSRAAQALEGRGWLPEPVRSPAAPAETRTTDRIAVEIVRGEAGPMHVEAAE